MNPLDKKLLDLVDELFNLTDSEHREVLKLYKQSRDDIKTFIAELYMKYGNKDGVLELSELQKYNRMKIVEQQFNDILNSQAKNEIKLMTTILSSMYVQSYNKTAYTLEQGVQTGVRFNIVKQEFIDEAVNYNWSGVPFSERIWHNTNSLTNALRTEMIQGIQQGKSLNQISKSIDKQFGTKSFQSQRLIRTESARVINSAQTKIYQDSGVVPELIYTATLDNKTSKICRGLDGKRFKADDMNKPSIPAHPNCRSCYIPSIKDYQPTKRKDNQSKQIVDYLPYEEWQKSKGIK